MSLTFFFVYRSTRLIGSYSASSPNQQLANRNVATVGHIILILRQHALFLLLKSRELIGEAANRNVVFENVLGVWNFSAMFQNVCFDKLNVLCLCKIVYACHMFLYLYLPLLLFKNKQITKRKKITQLTLSLYYL